MTPPPLQPPLVLIAGGSSAAGIAVAASLLADGARVLTVGSDAGRIESAAELTGAVPLVCNLADPEAVAALVNRVHADFGPVDGLIHLVGGWRGGGGLAGQLDADWDFLHTSVLTTLRLTSRAFYDDLATSAVGRLAIVSSTSVTAPTAGNANYAAVKAAAETWVQAVAQGFDGAGTSEPQSAAVVLVVKALVDDAQRARQPQRSFPGFTDVAVLADAVAGLFTTPAAELNGTRIILKPTP